MKTVQVKHTFFAKDWKPRQYTHPPIIMHINGNFENPLELWRINGEYFNLNLFNFTIRSCAIFLLQWHLNLRQMNRLHMHYPEDLIKSIFHLNFKSLTWLHGLCHISYQGFFFLVMWVIQTIICVIQVYRYITADNTHASSLCWGKWNYLRSIELNCNETLQNTTIPTINNNNGNMNQQQGALHKLSFIMISNYGSWL